MSIRILSQVWEFGPDDRGELLVLLALADFADDLGRCWPSINTIAKRARMSPRSAQRILRKMQDDGVVKISTGTGRAGCNEYILTPDTVSPRHSVTPDTRVTPSPDTRVTPPLTPVSPEPSLNHQLEPSLFIEAQAPRKPRDLITAILSQVASTESVASFIAYRAKIKKPLTEIAAKRIAAQLSEIMARRPSDCLDDWASDALGMVEEKGWQSIQTDWYINARGSNNGNGNSKLSGSGPNGAGPTMGDALAFAARRKAAQRSRGAGGGGGFI